jgi:hypothetical protein
MGLEEGVGKCQPYPVFSNRKPGLRLESGQICVMDELLLSVYLGKRIYL